MVSPGAHHVTLAAPSASSVRASFPSQNDRERSRNAKAQARHRAKRKAYVEQLEQTVTKLQSALALSSDDLSSIPAPLNRIRELEDENSRLLQENGELRRQIESRNAQLRPDIGRRIPASADLDCEYDDRGVSAGNWSDFSDYKKRYGNQDADREYLSRQAAPRSQIPQGHYSLSSTLSSSRSMYSGSMNYQVASPLSTSSATPSPSFTPHHLSPIVPRSSGHHHLPSINDHYPVKVEDDTYLPTPSLPHGHHYAYTPNEPVSVGTNPWHAYPSERHDIQS